MGIKQKIRNGPLLKVEVVSPVKVLYKGEAQAVSSVNEEGLFDILPGHTSFISLIRDKVVIYVGKGRKEIDLDKGVVRCRNNEVKVFVGL